MPDIGAGPLRRSLTPETVIANHALCPHRARMAVMGSRGRVTKRVLAAHAFGLCITGIAGTIGTSEGFSFDGAGLGLSLGGLLSLPWMAALGIAIWWRGRQIDRHPIAFATIGPVIVGVSWGLVTGAFFEKAVVISSVASSAFYLTTIVAQHALSVLRPQELNVR